MKPPSAELARLCGAVCDEIATPEEVARLEKLLATSAEARQFYLRFSRLGALLERYQPSRGPAAWPASPVSQWRLAARWLALGAGMAALLLVFFAVRRSSDRGGRGAAASIAILLDAHAATVTAADGTTRRVRGGQRLLPGEVIAIGRGGGAVVRCQEEGTHFVLGAETRVGLEFGGNAKTVRLEFGQISGNVGRQPPGTHWRIVTADGEAAVLGTQLAVTADRGGTQVGVASGRVRVTARDSRESVETSGGYGVQLTPRTAVLSKLPLTAPTRIVGFTLIDADTIEPIRGFENLADGAVLDLAALLTRRLNIRANAEPLIVGSICFELAGIDASGRLVDLTLPLVRPNGFPNSIEIFYPYLLTGDPSPPGQPLAEYSNPWIPARGRYTLTATPYAGVNGSGARGIPLAVQFEVVDGAAAR